MQVIVNNRVVAYEKVGSGPVAVLLHGWADSQASFAQLLPDLKRLYTVITLDLAGFGGSQPPETAWGLADYAAFVKAFLVKINVGHVHLLVGHSNGGAIAVYASAHKIIEADKLILLASSGVRTPGSARKKALKAVSKVGKLSLAVLPKSRRQALRARFYTSIGSDLLVAPHMQETFKKVVAQDIQTDAKLIRVPVLLIYGSNDTATPPLYGQMLTKKLPAATLKIIEGAGHFVHQESAAAVSALIKEFDPS